MTWPPSLTIKLNSSTHSQPQGDTAQGISRARSQQEGHEHRLRCAAQCACVLRNYRLEIDNLCRFVAGYKEKKEQALRCTQHFPRCFVHQEYILKTHATNMQSVAVVLDMLEEEYSKALAAELSTDNEKGRSWVRIFVFQELLNVCP